jgi:SAM-dependent methyltransferase
MSDKKYSHFGDVTKRGIESYEIILKFKIEDLIGKDILDIGIGFGKFQKECRYYQEKNKDHFFNVIGTDPVYYDHDIYLKNNSAFDDDFREHISDQKNRENIISAINEILPFRNNSFDAVLNCWSSISYYWLNYEKEKQEQMLKQMFNEIIRVLKPGGAAYIGGYIDDYKLAEKILSDINTSKKLKIRTEWTVGGNSYDSIYLEKKSS